MKFDVIFRAMDAAVALHGATRKLLGHAPAETAMARSSAGEQGLAGQLETRLSNVVVAALKEAFDRDHARLELERAQLEEQRRRAEEALRLELARQAADREVGRLRLLAGMALIGWMASVLLLGWRIPLTSPFGRFVLGVGWLLLLGAIGSAFSAMGRVGDAVRLLASRAGNVPDATRAAQLPLWLLMLGLALTAVTLLL